MPSNAHVGQATPNAARTTFFREAMSSVTIATDGTADLYYTVDGTVATTGSTKLAAGTAREVNVAVTRPGNTIVSVISTGNPAYSVCPGSYSLSRPPHTAGLPIYY